MIGSVSQTFNIAMALLRANPVILALAVGIGTLWFIIKSRSQYAQATAIVHRPQNMHDALKRLAPQQNEKLLPARHGEQKMNIYRSAGIAPSATGADYLVFGNREQFLTSNADVNAKVRVLTRSEPDNKPTAGKKPDTAPSATGGDYLVFDNREQFLTSADVNAKVRVPTWSEPADKPTAGEKPAITSSAAGTSVQLFTNTNQFLNASNLNMAGAIRVEKAEQADGSTVDKKPGMIPSAIHGSAKARVFENWNQFLNASDIDMGKPIIVENPE